MKKDFKLYIYINAFGRRFYTERLALHFFILNIYVMFSIGMNHTLHITLHR